MFLDFGLGGTTILWLILCAVGLLDLAKRSNNSTGSKWKFVLQWVLVTAAGTLGFRGVFLLAFGFGDGTGDSAWAVALPLLAIVWVFLVVRTLVQVLRHPAGLYSK